MPPTSRDIFQRLTEQAMAFQQFAGQLSTNLSQFNGSGDGLAAFWKLPLDTWSRTVSSASVFPGDFLESHKPEVWNTLADGFQRHLERFLSVPALGYTREAQEQGREMVRLALEYQRALQAYSATFRAIVPESLTRLQQRLAQRAEPITTLRAFYDLWVDTSEEVYLELVATEQHALAYGQMVNALMALKNHGRNMVDEIVGALGMPTRHGLNTLQRRQQELRRELVVVRRELGEARAVQDELAELRREVQALRKTARKTPKEG
jgi:class III poly(R)-hydroxyalkanoic acid synthase PhaE subunit